jgi:glycosyltransferase involved in cell wall biosynthesis
MNVLMMTDKLVTGGAESYFCKLENTLAHPDLHIYTAAATGDLVSKLKHKQNYTEISRKNHLDNIRKIKSTIIKQKINVIHANSLRMALYAIAIKRTSRIPFKIIYTKHNQTVLESKGPLFVYLMNRFIDQIIAVSQYEKDKLISLGVKKNKIQTIYNGVDLEQFRFQTKEKSEAFHVGILARLSEEKNHTLFLEIANKLKEMSSLTFHIAGEGPENEKIVNKISSLGLSHKVKMVGAVNQPERFIKEMDLLLLTSHTEVFPMVILEAMAVGTPVISIDRGGIKEAIQHEETGYLIPDHQVEAYCEKIVTMTLHRHLSENFVHNGRKRVEENFTVNKMIDHTLEEYLKCL